MCVCVLGACKGCGGEGRLVGKESGGGRLVGRPGEPSQSTD